jgi:phospholipase/lecithinase/hemolysin
MQTHSRCFKRSGSLATASVIFGCLSIAQAGTISFSQMVIFGDSLSDTGNLYKRDLGLYPTTPNYAPGIFTDGYSTLPASTAVYNGLWDQDLAYLLGVPIPTPSTTGGTDYAFGGAVTGSGTSDLGLVDNMGQQVNSYLAANGGHAASNDLYVLWGGANDLLNAAEASGATPASVAAAEKTAIQNLESEILFLATSGAQQFMWLDVPDLADTPEAKTLSPALQTALATASAQFRTDFGVAEMGLPSLFTNVSITGIDVYSVFNYIIANSSQFGLTDVTDSAQGASVNPDTYLFWDGVHPTTTGHALLALYIDSVLTQASTADASVGTAMDPTPEPSTLASAFVLLAAILGYRLRTRIARKTYRDPEAGPISTPLARA